MRRIFCFALLSALVGTFTGCAHPLAEDVTFAHAIAISIKAFQADQMVQCVDKDLEWVRDDPQPSDSELRIQAHALRLELWHLCDVAENLELDDGERLRAPGSSLEEVARLADALSDSCDEVSFSWRSWGEQRFPSSNKSR